MKKKTAVFLFLIIVFSIPALRALAIPEFYTSHDGITHTARLANYYLAIKEGQIPPRLAPTLFAGLGFPMFIFIYPLPYLIGAALHSVGLTFTASFEIVIGASFLLSAITMYFFLQELLGATPAFVGALFYSWAPYRFSQLYVRAAIAESFAYIFVPLVLLALLKLSKDGRTRWAGVGSLSLAGLLLSHHLVSLMFLPIFFVFGLIFLKEAKNKRSYLFSSLLIAFLGFASAAFIYLPSLFERKFLRFDELINYYLDHFVTIPQLIHSPWSYGFSMPGTINDDMSFQVGLTHLLAAGLSILALLSLILKRKSQTPPPYFWVGLTSAIVFGVSIALMLEHPLVGWVWKNVPAISIIDFPWRLLGVSVFASSFLAAFLVKATNNKLLLFLLLFFVFYANRNHLRINQSLALDDSYFLNYEGTATYRNEFLPKWRKTNKFEHLEKNFKVQESNMRVMSIETKTHRVTLEVETAEPGRIDIHRLYFPGWQVFLDGKPLRLGDQLQITEQIDIETETSPYVDRSGLLRVMVPPGRHTILATFKETPLRKAGFGLSFLGLFFSLGLTLKDKVEVTAVLRKSKPKVRRKR